MNRSEPIVPKEGGESGKAGTLVSMFVACPLEFTLLFLFLAVLAIPIKAFDPETKIFR